MRALVAAVALALSLSGCTDPAPATRILEAEGFTQIEITGYRFFSCSEKDTFATGFRAMKNGRTVTGTVCSGWLKGHTVRFD